jgi:cytochrome o ubiquinol oxidase subunit II
MRDTAGDMGFRRAREPSRLSLARLAAVLAALASLLALSGCNLSVLDPRGPIGQANKTLLIDSVAIMLAIVIPTMVATLAFAWWFRASNRRAFYLPDWEYSGQLELIVWAIPMLTIMLLGGVAWVGSHDLDPGRPIQSKAAALEVQVVSLDWKWLFIYPDLHVASVNRLVLPANTPVHFALTSGSVMSAFFVPQLGSMIYTMNGMSTELNLQADEVGNYLGLSSHFNGDGFAGMHFDTEVVPWQQFVSWVDKTRANGPTLNSRSYIELSKQTLDVQPFTYSDVELALYERIVDQTLPPGPGPIAETNPGASRRTGN